MSDRLFETVREVEQTIRSICGAPSDNYASLAPNVMRLSQDLQKLANELEPHHTAIEATSNVRHKSSIPCDGDVDSTCFDRRLSKNKQLAATKAVNLTETHAISLDKRLCVTPAGSSTSNVSTPAAIALNQAVKIIPVLRRAIDSMSADTGHILNEDHRIAHLRPLQQIKGSRHRNIQKHDRLYLVLAATSIADDFRLFEQQSGWIPKQDQLLLPLLSDKAPLTQQIASHTENFIASMTSIDRDRLKGGLAFGIKLQVLSGLFECSLIGCGLACILGFECNKIMRLSYRNFGSLRFLVEFDPAYATLKAVATDVGLWFIRQRQQYDQSYRFARSVEGAIYSEGHTCQTPEQSQERVDRSACPGSNLVQRSLQCNACITSFPNPDPLSNATSVMTSWSELSQYWTCSSFGLETTTSLPKLISNEPLIPCELLSSGTVQAAEPL